MLASGRFSFQGSLAQRDRLVTVFRVINSVAADRQQCFLGVDLTEPSGRHRLVVHCVRRDFDRSDFHHLSVNAQVRRIRECRRATALAAGCARPIHVAFQPDHERTARFQGLAVALPFDGLVLGRLGPDSVAHLGRLLCLTTGRVDFATKPSTRYR